jgi:type I restriction enzyme R subunit
MFIGFTGTPVSFATADTVDVFGDVIHTYDIRQSQLDHATVPIYYEPRQVKLHLSQADIDSALDEVAAGEEPTTFERKKSRWAALASAAGARERVDEIARDLLMHYHDRTETLAGKAMVVCMTRANCVKLYDALTALPGCPEVKVVMTGDLTKDPEGWSRRRLLSLSSGAGSRRLLCSRRARKSSRPSSTEAPGRLSREGAAVRSPPGGAGSR